MLKHLRKSTYLLSSNWYKRFKIPYLILVSDITFILLFGIFAVKDYLIGTFDANYPYNGILILIIVSVLLILRFNISLLMFSRQRFGLYLSILFLLIALSLELIFDDMYSPFMLVFGSVVLFINNFIIQLPDLLNTLLVYLFYTTSIYGPLLYYIFLRLRKINLKDSASTFDIVTGFYASTISKKLKIMDMVVYGFVIGIAMTIGLVSKDINWNFLSVPITLYTIYEFFKRMYFPNKTKKKQIIIYSAALIMSFGVMYTQKIPYLGLIFFLFSVIFMFSLIATMSKSIIRSLFVTIYSFIMIPIFCMGYNLFTFPQYGTVKKSIPFEHEKIFYHIVDKDGLKGIRNRRYKAVRPAYTKIIYCEKNVVKLLNKKGEWETYHIPISSYPLRVKEIEIFKKKYTQTLK